MNLFLKKSECFSRKIVPFPGEFVKVIAEKYAIFRIYVARELAFCLEIWIANLDQYLSFFQISINWLSWETEIIPQNYLKAEYI